VADRLSGALQKHGVSLNTNTAQGDTLPSNHPEAIVFDFVQP
jgi:hypothetical protein